MKTALIKSLVAAGAVLSFVGLAGQVGADDSTPESKVAAGNSRTYAGRIKSVDEKERTITVETFWSTKTFAVGDNCRVQLEDKSKAFITDLRPGHQVDVQYLAKDGVKIASLISQNDSIYTGHVSVIDPIRHTFVVKRGLGSKAFVAKDDCKVVIREDKDAGLAGLKTGHKVTVHYLAGRPENIACKVEQNSLIFSGTVEAIDVTTGTLKARKALTDRRFRLADDCPIIINGQADGKLRDLRIGDKLTFHYEEVDGVLVANRIARENSAAKTPTDQQFTRTE